MWDRSSVKMKSTVVIGVLVNAFADRGKGGELCVHGLDGRSWLGGRPSRKSLPQSVGLP